MNRRVGGAPPGTETALRASDGASLAVTELVPPAGARARTVVLVHGWGGARAVWEAVVPRLTERGHRVVLFDQRGHGVSTTGSAGVSLERLRDDLAAVLDHTGTTDAVLVGHSGGGYAVLAYAAGDPAVAAQRLRGLVLVSTATHDQDTSAGELRMMGSGVFSWALRRPALGRKLLGQMVGPDADRLTAERNRRLFAGTPAPVRQAFFRISCGMDLRPGLPVVTVPTVVLAGSADRIIKPSYGADLARALPAARHEEIAGAGHMLPLEGPDHIVRAVADVA